MTKVKLKITRFGRGFCWTLCLPRQAAADYVNNWRNYPRSQLAVRSAKRWAARHGFEIVEVVKG